MEHHAQSVDDALIGGLSYKLKSGASYVTNRRSVSFFPMGGNSYSPTGVKVIKFNLTGDQWLEPNSLRVMFQVNNADAANWLKPLHWNPAVFFRRARLIAGGQVVEDIDNFNRLSLMLSSLKTTEQQLIEASEGFGSYDETGNVYRTYDVQWTDDAGHVVHQSGRRVMFKPILGLFNQEKLLPLRYCPLQIELELVSNTNDAVNTNVAYSNSWNISDVQIKCDLLTLDNALDNEYAEHLLSGKSLPINFASFNHTVHQSGGGKNFSVNVARALTRIKSVFVTLYRSEVAPEALRPALKEANYFYHPADQQANDEYILEDEHQFWIQVGSKLFPEYPINSATEALYQLRKTVGVPFNMIGRWYRTSKYILGIDMEKVSGAGFTGLNTKAGDLITLNFRDCDFGGSNVPDKVFCVIHYDSVLNVQDSGVSVLE